jgi:hypothetical protein
MWGYRDIWRRLSESVPMFSTWIHRQCKSHNVLGLRQVPWVGPDPMVWPCRRTQTCDAKGQTRTRGVGACDGDVDGVGLESSLRRGTGGNECFYGTSCKGVILNCWRSHEAVKCGELYCAVVHSTVTGPSERRKALVPPRIHGSWDEKIGSSQGRRRQPKPPCCCCCCCRCRCRCRCRCLACTCLFRVQTGWLILLLETSHDAGTNDACRVWRCS